MTRCEACDRPVAANGYDINTSHDELCWGGAQCESKRVDWRARWVASEERAMAEWATGEDWRNKCYGAEDRAMAAQRDLAAARERIANEERVQCDLADNALRLAGELLAAEDRIGELEEIVRQRSGARDEYADQLACLREALGIEQRGDDVEVAKHLVALGKENETWREETFRYMRERDAARREAEELRADLDYQARVASGGIENMKAVGSAMFDYMRIARDADARAERLEAENNVLSDVANAWRSKHTETVQLMRRLVAGDSGAASDARVFIEHYEDWLRLIT
jgi:hypothetical protein